jgi:hypothetical protein
MLIAPCKHLQEQLLAQEINGKRNTEDKIPAVRLDTPCKSNTDMQAIYGTSVVFRILNSNGEHLSRAWISGVGNGI